jgi:hypothetical protein
VKRRLPWSIRFKKWRFEHKDGFALCMVSVLVIVALLILLPAFMRSSHASVGSGGMIDRLSYVPEDSDSGQ